MGDKCCILYSEYEEEEEEKVFRYVNFKLWSAYNPESCLEVKNIILTNILSLNQVPY